MGRAARMVEIPSQRSESVWLNAGQNYYIEAIQEQAVGGDNLAVAWQGPTITHRHPAGTSESVDTAVPSRA